nr:MAG TPA: hypothetical protein [Caudoviricetes sp.]
MLLKGCAQQKGAALIEAAPEWSQAINLPRFHLQPQ